MNWWKRTFGKRNWITIAQGTCSAQKSEFFGACNRKVSAWWFVEYDEERKSYRSYFTDGDIRKDIDIRILAQSVEGLREVLKDYEIYV